VRLKTTGPDLSDTEAARCAEPAAAEFPSAPAFHKISRDRMRMLAVETQQSTQILGQILAVLDAWNAIAFTISIRRDRVGQFVDLCCDLPTAEACVMIPRALKAIENVRYAALKALPAI